MGATGGLRDALEGCTVANTMQLDGKLRQDYGLLI
jgi:hypothetical protein